MENNRRLPRRKVVREHKRGKAAVADRIVAANKVRGNRDSKDKANKGSKPVVASPDKPLMAAVGVAVGLARQPKGSGGWFGCWEQITNRNHAESSWESPTALQQKWLMVACRKVKPSLSARKFPAMALRQAARVLLDLAAHRLVADLAAEAPAELAAVAGSHFTRLTN